MFCYKIKILFNSTPKIVFFHSFALVRHNSAFCFALNHIQHEISNVWRKIEQHFWKLFLRQYLRDLRKNRLFLAVFRLNSLQRIYRCDFDNPISTKSFKDLQKKKTKIQAKMFLKKFCASENFVNLTMEIVFLYSFLLDKHESAVLFVLKRTQREVSNIWEKIEKYVFESGSFDYI